MAIFIQFYSFSQWLYSSSDKPSVSGYVHPVITPSQWLYSSSIIHSVSVYMHPVITLSQWLCPSSYNTKSVVLFILFYPFSQWLLLIQVVPSVRGHMHLVITLSQWLYASSIILAVREVMPAVPGAVVFCMEL